jgi:sugar lactone lactonase YvrE
MPEAIGWLAERQSGGLVAGFASGWAYLWLDPVRIEPFGDPEPHLPANRMNDGKADADGNIWCGTMAADGKGDSGSLYQLRPDKSWSMLDSGYGITNGPAFSADGKWVYHTDTVRRIIYRFRRTAEGIADREPFIAFKDGDGDPDGMTVDRDNGLWVAHWNGSRVSRFLPSGEFDRSIELPAKQITNVIFGGDDLDRMFVTSAAVGLPPGQYDGAFFEVESDAVGLPPGLFAG